MSNTEYRDVQYRVPRCRICSVPRCPDTMNPRHLGTWKFRYWLGHRSRYSVLDISILTWTSRYWTVRDLDETIFGTDHNCLVLINCQYFCTGSSLISCGTVALYRVLLKKNFADLYGRSGKKKKKKGP